MFAQSLLTSVMAFPSSQPAQAIASADVCRAAIRDAAIADVAPLPRVFGLLSWNIHKGMDAGWQSDLRELGKSIHLLLLQEAQPGPSLDPLLDALPHRHFAPGFSFAGKATGVLTASSAPPLLRCTLYYREPWLGTPKSTAITLYALGEQRAGLLAINLHGVNLSLGTRMFGEQILALDPILGAHSGPVILGGDINAWSETRLAAVDRLARRHGLRRQNFSPDLRSRIIGLAMDYIYVRGLDTVIAEVVPVTSSDHNPLLMKLALPFADAATDARTQTDKRQTNDYHPDD